MRTLLQCAFLSRTGVLNARGGVPVFRSRLNTPRCAVSTQVSGGNEGGYKDWDAKKYGFHVQSERVVWKRYKTVLERNVRYPNGKVVSFDINASLSGASVLVFPFCTRTRTTTMLREYAPGGHRFHTGFVAGFYEPHKHATLEQAARAEMSEEAHLKNGQLVLLGNPIQADKYSDNRFYYYLALDAEKDEAPAQRDADEVIETIPNVPLQDVANLIAKGSLNAPNALLGLLALDELRNRGYHA